MRFGVFGDVFVLIKPKIAIISVCAKRIFAHSLNRNKYFWRILGIRKKNEACAENKFALSTMPDNYKEAVFRENRIEDHILTREEQSTSLVVWLFT
jgi:hypothetical protein